MRLFYKGKKYESEIIPPARIVVVDIISSMDDTYMSTIIGFNTPFKKWRKYINPWNFGHTEGWCTWSCYLRYNMRLKKWWYHHYWTPLER